MDPGAFDDEVLVYLWEQMFATGREPEVTLSDASAVRPTFTAPSSDAVLTFRLTVKDKYGAIGTDFATVSIQTSPAASSNSPPQANAGDGQTVNPGETVTLNGSESSDPDSDTLTYQWKQLFASKTDAASASGVGITGSASATATFTAPIAAGTLAFRLTVSDDNGGVDWDVASVRVKDMEDVGSIAKGESVARSGSWGPGIVSPNRAGSYARFYIFGIRKRAKVRIGLSSGTANPYLNLMSEAGKSGQIMARNDDYADAINQNALIERVLDPGIYTVEATTATAGESGDFDLDIRVYSDDATLRDLSLSVAEASLTPEFAPGHTVYNAKVANSVDGIQITPTVNQAGARVAVNSTAVNSGEASGSFRLLVGTNTFNVKVTADDGTTTKTYTIAIKRVSADASLNALSISEGTLVPDFGTATDNAYRAQVGNGVASITVTPTSPHTAASITVNGIAVNSGEASQALSLEVGDNTITVVVTAEDEATTKTYTIVARRAAAITSTPTPPVTEEWSDWSDTGNTRGSGADREKEQSRTSNLGNSETQWVAEPEIWSDWSDTGNTRGSGADREKEQSRTSNLGNTETQWVAEPEIWGDWSDTGNTRGSGADREKEQSRTSNLGNSETQWVAEPEIWGPWTATGLSSDTNPLYTEWADTGTTSGCGPTKRKEQSRTRMWQIQERRTSDYANVEHRWVERSATETTWVADPEPERWGVWAYNGNIRNRGGGTWTDTGSTRGSLASREKEQTSTRTWEEEQTRTSHCNDVQRQWSSRSATSTRWVSYPEPVVWGSWSDTGTTRGCGPGREKQRSRTSNYGNTQKRWVLDSQD